MKRYFENKIGQTLGRTVTTGNKAAFTVYARQYYAEILDVKDYTKVPHTVVAVNLRSEDLTPSGMLAGGTQRYWGDFRVDPGEGLEDFWKALLKQADPTMAGYLNRRMRG